MVTVDDDITANISSDYREIVFHRCLENGSLVVPIFINATNQSITESSHVRTLLLSLPLFDQIYDHITYDSNYRRAERGMYKYPDPIPVSNKILIFLTLWMYLPYVVRSYNNWWPGKPACVWAGICTGGMHLLFRKPHWMKMQHPEKFFTRIRLFLSYNFWRYGE